MFPFPFLSHGPSFMMLLYAVCPYAYIRYVEGEFPRLVDSLLPSLKLGWLTEEMSQLKAGSCTPLRPRLCTEISIQKAWRLESSSWGKITVLSPIVEDY